MAFKWVIRQDRKHIAKLCLVDSRSVVGSRETWEYYGADFETAKQAAIKDLTEIREAPLEMVEENKKGRQA